jgi:hypothetical protein
MQIINSVFTGLLSGIIAPALTLYLYCRLTFPLSTFMEEIEKFNSRNVLSHVVSLSVLINLLLFFIFIWTKKENSAKGVIGATIIYGLFIAYLQLR